MAASSASAGPVTKKVKRASKWQPEWTRYNMTASQRGASFVHCKVCGIDFSVAGGGVHEIKRHIDTKKHKENVRGMTNQLTLTSTMPLLSTNSLENDITAAELYFTTFIAEHNIPFLAADHFTKLCKSMFPDSKIADGFSCSRTKTTAIVKCALAPAFNAEVVNICQTSPFTILCDGGNDQFGKKYFAVMVRVWEESRRQAVTRFLAMPVCNVSTAEALFNALKGELESNDIPWKNVIGYVSDTASVMVGVRNSVLSRIKLKQPTVFSLGCLCHLAALCAVAALTKLPVSVDDFLIDISYHFKYSAKRWTEYAEIRDDFSEIQPLRILKHCTTRWLSLERCIKRVIDQWPALYAYFDREVDIEPTNERVQRIAKHLEKPLVKLICHFVSFALKPLNKFSQAFQTHASRIGSLQSDVRVLLQGYMSNFIKPEVITNADDITEISYLDRNNQVEDSELGIGTSTRLLLCGELEDEITGTIVESRFFSSVRSFYEVSVSKMIAKFPFSDDTLKELAFLDPRNRVASTPSGITNLACRFSSFSTDEIDSLMMEFRDYRIAPDDQLPVFMPSDSAAVDHFWFAMGELKAITDLSTLRFGNLVKLAKILLVLPHSNVDPERLFSMVRKIETDQRKRLDPSTVSDLLSTKINNDHACYDNKHLTSESFLRSVKTATRRSLERSSSTETMDST
jgi:hypothetical protein